MEILRVSAVDYAGALPEAGNIYNSVAFTGLNAGLCDDTAYLLFRADGKVKGGLVMGLRQGIWRTPFSAPFGGLALPKHVTVETVEEMWRLAAGFVRGEGGGEMLVTLPPVFYDADLYAKSVNVLSRMPQAAPAVWELNYHADLRGVERGADIFSYNARGSLKQALRLPFRFERLEPTAAGIERVYRVISLNHAHRGYPVNMPLERVIATAPVVGAAFFMLSLEGEDIAAAQVHHPAPGIAQIIYWGDVPGHQATRPMHRLAAAIYDYYIGRGDISVVDIGISTVDAVPNPGLCFFKESIGCVPTPKPTFRIG